MQWHIQGAFLTCPSEKVKSMELGPRLLGSYSIALRKFLLGGGKSKKYEKCLSIIIQGFNI